MDLLAGWVGRPPANAVPREGSESQDDKPVPVPDAGSDASSAGEESEDVFIAEATTPAKKTASFRSIAGDLSSDTGEGDIEWLGLAQEDLAHEATEIKVLILSVEGPEEERTKYKHLPGYLSLSRVIKRLEEDEEVFRVVRKSGEEDEVGSNFI